jgi:glycosyltransferase involved in cell wall biosynthesis
VKKRVLMTTEASFLHTGYAVYGKEVLSRLYKTGEFELAEFGAFAKTDDQRAHNIPWKFYGNLPDNEQQAAIYNSSMFNHFGAWRFNEVLLHFKPDVVISYRDPWMMQHETESPLRPYFSYMQMPTVDSYGQDPSWLFGFSMADFVTTYQDWSLRILEKEGGDLVNTVFSTPPAANEAVFRPVADRAEWQGQFFDGEVNVIGMVARNQCRKLFPHLLNAFKMTLESLPKDVADRTYLYLHTSFPDNGWPIDRMLAESGLANKVLFTYICQHCKFFAPGMFSTKIKNCDKCGQYAMMMPNVQAGLPEEQLAAIMNLFDVYVQYHLSEGFGMPLVEAAYCGVPIMGTNFSAVEDILEKCGGTPIAVSQYFKEAPTYMTRAYPDDKDLARKLAAFLLKPKSLRAAQGAQTRAKALKHFHWDKTAARWGELLRQVSGAKPWNSPRNIFQPQLTVPNIQSNEDFVRFCITHILGRPEMLDTYFHMKLLKELNEGVCTESMSGSFMNDACLLSQKPAINTFDRQKLADNLLKMRENINNWELRRAQS